MYLYTNEKTQVFEIHAHKYVVKFPMLLFRVLLHCVSYYFWKTVWVPRKTWIHPFVLKKWAFIVFMDVSALFTDYFFRLWLVFLLRSYILSFPLAMGHPSFLCSWWWSEGGRANEKKASCQHSGLLLLSIFCQIYPQAFLLASSVPLPTFMKTILLQKVTVILISENKYLEEGCSLLKPDQVAGLLKCYFLLSPCSLLQTHGTTRSLEGILRKEVLTSVPFGRKMMWDLISLSHKWSAIFSSFKITFCFTTLL